MMDVARLAGVSHQTVSRVLNASPAVGPELTLRVQEAIQLLGYKRNPAARALASRRSMNLGVISFGISLYGPSLTLFGIAEAARQAGYTTSLITLADFERQAVRAAFDHLEEASVDGVIAVAPFGRALDMIRGLAEDLPLITFEPGVVGKETSAAIDEVLGARLATRHLLDLGHETVWHVSGPEGWLGSDARIKGWREELAANRRVAHEIVGGRVGVRPRAIRRDCGWRRTGKLPPSSSPTTRCRSASCRRCMKHACAFRRTSVLWDSMTFPKPRIFCPR